jgi:hypothetical protein
MAVCTHDITLFELGNEIHKRPTSSAAYGKESIASFWNVITL